MIIRLRHKQSSRGSIIIIIAIIVMAVILLFTIITAGAMIGDRTGVGGGSGGKTAPDGSPIVNEPIVPVDGACPKVQTMGQKRPGYCGRASQAQVIAFWQGNTEKYLNLPFLDSHRMAAGTLSSLSSKSYHFTNSVQEVADSLKSGKPVIAYTRIFISARNPNGNHIIVLTCFDATTQIFTANDSEPKANGRQSIQSINGHPLSVSNIGPGGPYSGQSFFGHANFLVTN